ncbi:MAG: hypothetical protein A2147_07080 [Chloroflexi bacterium RBG_16_57_8]|nr:MAG: hypothetical protein A2147_07080 [Chloroflexi bacterium RBG_16_57_8]
MAMKQEYMPWQWLLLGILDDSGGTAALSNIYASIEEAMRSDQPVPQIIRVHLITVDPKYGDRPRYQHTVRGCLAAYKKQGLVERVDRGIYRLTQAGGERLQYYKKSY